MKTLLTIVTFGLSIALTAQDSLVNIADYFAANPKWVETYVGLDSSVEPVDVHLYLEGDSTLDGKTYHKLFSIRDRPIDSFDDRVGKHLQGLIRQEGRIIYYRGFILANVPYNSVFPITENSPLPGKEVRLYDFSLGVGDTLFIQDNPLFHSFISRYPDDTSLVVDVVNNDYYKFYPNSFAKVICFKSNTFDQPSLEAIGYLPTDFGAGGFFLGQYSIYSTFLKCYTNDSIQSNPDDIRIPFQYQYSNCDFVTSVEDNEPIQSATFYPQPSQGVIYIHNAAIKSYSLYNSRGQQVLNKQNSSATQINISHLPKGLYFLHYSTSQGQQGVEKVFLDVRN